MRSRNNSAVQKNGALGRLSVTGTPIGNLKDITLRAIDVLKSCDAVACEDTRVTRKLLSSLDISKPLLSVHEHSVSSKLDQVVAFIQNGGHVCYVSDAGTPGISDPGPALVDACLKAGIPVEAVPGPSALAAAVSLCHFKMDEFIFAGFLPKKESRAADYLKRAAASGRPVIFLESPHRLWDTLKTAEQIFGPGRQAMVCREITKYYEETIRGTLAEILLKIEGREILGELVVIIGAGPAQSSNVDLTLEQAVDTITTHTNMTRKDALKLAAALTGRNKREYFKILHAR